MHNIIKKISCKKNFKVHFKLFASFFVDFSVSFQYFLKRVSALKFPLDATEYHAYKSVPSKESIKLMNIIEAKMGQIGRK